jgi:FkbM family methyltransferase
MLTHEPHLDKFVALANNLLGDSIRTVVECGAKDCSETIAFHKLLPQAEIYAFECSPDNLPMCRSTIHGVDKIHLVEKAVSDKCGDVPFFKIDTSRTRTTWLDGNPGASSLFLASGKYPAEDYAQTSVTVTAVTLWNFITTTKLGIIDLLWMDIQGAELLALSGLGPAITQVRLIHLEVEFIEIYSGQPLWCDVRRFLRSHGFRLLTFTTFGRYSADAVFFNPALVSNCRRWLPDWLVYSKYLIAYLLHGLSLRVRRMRSISL